MGDQDCVCRHEEEIILMKDHVKDIGVDTKKILKRMDGNGSPGIMTRLALTEQSVSRLQKYQWFNMTAILGAAIKIMFFGG